MKAQEIIIINALSERFKSINQRIEKSSALSSREIAEVYHGNKEDLPDGWIGDQSKERTVQRIIYDYLLNLPVYTGKIKEDEVLWYVDYILSVWKNIAEMEKHLFVELSKDDDIRQSASVNDKKNFILGMIPKAESVLLDGYESKGFDESLINYYLTETSQNRFPTEKILSDLYDSLRHGGEPIGRREKGHLEKEGKVLYDEHGDFYLKDKKWKSNFKRRLSLLQNKICIHLPENHKDYKDHEMGMMYVDALQARLGIDRPYKQSDDPVCIALLDKPPVVKQLDGKYTIHSPQTEKPYEDMVLVADQNDEEGLAAFYSPQWGTYILVDLESGNIPKTKMRKEPFFTLNDAIKEAKKDFKKSFTLRVDQPPVEKDAVYDEYTLLGQYGTYKGTTVRIVRVDPEKESISIAKKGSARSKHISIHDEQFQLKKPTEPIDWFWYIWKQSKGKYGLTIGYPTDSKSKVQALGADKDTIENLIGQSVSPNHIINLTKDSFYYWPEGNSTKKAKLSDFFTPSFLQTLLRLEAPKKNPSPERTAIARTKLSAPMKHLEKDGYLSGDYTILDYGSGRGDDVRILKDRGVSARSYDPHFHPREPKRKANIVNLGYVLNVIDSPKERQRVLKKAFDLATDLLVVAVRTGKPQSRGRPFKDGILTTHDTFQKYYTTPQIKKLIKKVLKKESISVGNGILYVFKRE